MYRTGLQQIIIGLKDIWTLPNISGNARKFQKNDFLLGRYFYFIWYQRRWYAISKVESNLVSKQRYPKIIFVAITKGAFVTGQVFRIGDVLSVAREDQWRHRVTPRRPPVPPLTLAWHCYLAGTTKESTGEKRTHFPTNTGTQLSCCRTLTSWPPFERHISADVRLPPAPFGLCFVARPARRFVPNTTGINCAQF